MGGALGVTSVPGFGSSMSLHQALSNDRTDGFGALYREGTASFLNSMVNRRFPFTTQQVRDNFVQATGSNKAAAAQARVFKLANEGRLKPRNTDAVVELAKKRGETLTLSTRLQVRAHALVGLW